LDGSINFFKGELFLASKLFILLFVFINPFKSQVLYIDVENAEMVDVLSTLENTASININYSSSNLDTISSFSFSASGSKDHLCKIVMSALKRELIMLEKDNYALSLHPPTKDKIISPIQYDIQMIDEYGEPLPFGIVSIKGRFYETNNHGLVTISGFWSREENLELNYLGYIKRRVRIGELELTQLNHIVLENNEQQLGEVVVTDRTILNEKSLDGILLLPENINLAGITDNDGLAISQRIAGVYSSTESLDNIQIRGGTPDQTQYSWNGIRLLQSSLFYGKISSVNPLMTNQIRVNKSGASATSDNQASASISNFTELKNLDHISVAGYADLSHINTSIAIPLFKNKVKLKTAYRKSFDLGIPWNRFNTFQNQTFQTGTVANNEVFREIFNLDSLLSYESSFGFSDFSLTSEIDLSKKIKVKLSALQVENKFEYAEETTLFPDQDLLRLEIQNRGLSTEVDYQIIPSLMISTYFNATDYQHISSDFDDKLLIPVSLKKQVQNNVISNSVGIKTRYNIKDHFFHAHFKREHWNVTNSDIGYDNDFVTIFDNYANTASELSLGLNYNFENKWIQWNLGLQISDYSKADFQPLFIEPRLQLLLKPSPTFSVFANYGNYHQALHKSDLFTPLQASNSFWFLADASEGTNEWINLSTTRQFSLGIEKYFNDFSILLEAYQKRINNVWSSIYIFTYEENPYEYVDTNAKGIELTAKYKFSNFNFMSTANWTKESLQFAAPINELKSPYFQPLRLGLNLNYGFKNWNCTLSWQFAVGRYYSIPSGFESEITEEVENYTVIYDELLTKQNPNYHRLDLSVEYLKKFDKLNLNAGIGILNIYNRTNILTNQYFTDYTADPIRPGLFTRTGLPFSPELFLKFEI